MGGAGGYLMNDFPVMRDLAMRKGLWDRQGPNISSRYNGAVSPLKAVSLDREC